MLPSEYLEVRPYGDLKKLLENQVDMQFKDLRTLLRLPMPEHELVGGCNFTAGVVLLNLIAGASVCFYNASVAGLSDRRDRTPRFKGILRDFYPWDGEPLPITDCISAILDYTRHPLVHALGLDDPEERTRTETKLVKWPLEERQIAELEDSGTRPTWVRATVPERNQLADGSTETHLSVPTLYWGVHRMLRKLFGDPAHAVPANALAAHFKGRWEKGGQDSGAFDDSAVVVGRKCSTCGAEQVVGQDGHTYVCPTCKVA